MNKMCRSLFFLVCNVVASEQSRAIFFVQPAAYHSGVVDSGLNPDTAPFVPSVENYSQEFFEEFSFYKKTRRGTRGSHGDVQKEQESLLPKNLLEEGENKNEKRYFFKAIEINRPPLLLDGVWNPDKELLNKKNLPDWWLAVIIKAWSK